MTFKKLKFTHVLIGFAAIAQGVMWVNVFSLLHFGSLAYVAGFPAGISIVGIVTLGANRLPGTQSKRARRAGWIILPLLVIVETLVLGGANYAAFPNLIIAYGTSFAITTALIFGAIVERSLIPAQRTASKPKQEKRKPKPPAKVPCEWCGHLISDSQNARNAHAAYCVVLQEASKK